MKNKESTEIWVFGVDRKIVFSEEWLSAVKMRQSNFGSLAPM